MKNTAAPLTHAERLREAANRARIAQDGYMAKEIPVTEYDIAFREFNFLASSPDIILEIFAIIDKQKEEMREAEKALLESDKVVKLAHEKFTGLTKQVDDLKEFIVDQCLVYTPDGRNLVDASDYMPGAQKKEGE